MTCYDVFNGDADGICALQQLRLQFPRESILVSGMKRDIDLLQRVDAASGDEITVLDISLDRNREALIEALSRGASVFYADHHFAGEIPLGERLDCHIDTAPDTCTSLIIDDYLGHTQARWAVVGAFGDNFDQPAMDLGQSLGLDADDLAALQQLGICLNYNGYGFELEDLLFHPVDLFGLVRQYRDPLDFVENESGYAELLVQYRDDMARAENVPADSESAAGAVYLLPNEGWARRSVGVMGNELAKRFPERAHALLVDMGDGHYRVSVRAPYRRKDGADELCRQFPSGGGRKAAAGINALAQDSLARFVDRFQQQFGGMQ
ncbi:MAG: DHH family phosphoesterase [Gammaproteobacteria bacterium]|nr:DHH family phosphoesterase [Gammaproteobacteria bacterium]MDH3538299.1 DHH family phosphoesterase [Gammaproteobacteria bacterium]